MTKKIGIKAKSASDEEDGATLSRAQRKREEKAESRAELAAKRAEARRLAEQEEMELIGTAPRRHKVTEAELQRRREEAFAALQRVEEKRKKGMCRCVDDKEYRGMVCVANTNRVGLDVDARNVDEALAQLTLPEDRHPERRIMAFFKAFKETQLERLKQEKPGLTLSHYEDAIFKLWKKSPDKLQANGGLSKLNQTSTQTRQQ